MLPFIGMSKRALGFAALVVAGAIAALIVALGAGDKPPAARDVAAQAPGADSLGSQARAANLAVSDSVAAVPAKRPRPPVLPPEKSPAMNTTGVGDQPLWDVYDDEKRDPAWAVEKEQAIRGRLRPLLDAANHGKPGAISVPQVECREVHCRMLITGSDMQAFTRFVESLQDERGFYGDAALLALDGYGERVSKKTGKVSHEVRVHLKYDR